MPFRLKLLVPAALAVALAVLSLGNLFAAEQGVDRRRADVAGVPMELFLPADAQLETGRSKLPAVLVVHGFSGNRQLMYGFGYTLAKNGYAAALIDFAGHGASLDRLPDSFAGDVQYVKLASNIEAALAYLRAQAFVDPDRVAILGHSMGASAVARYGSTHPDVPVTIALSLGNFGRQLPPDPDQPRNFLILVGANEFAGFLQGSTAGLTAAYPDGIAGETYGDFVNGTARRLVYVPGVEHISILFSHDAYGEIVRWLDRAFGVASADRPLLFDSRIGWVLLFYLAAAIGFYPLAAALLGVQSTTVAPEKAGGRALPVTRAISGRRVLLAALIAAVVAPVLLRLGILPFRWMPLTVGNYVGAYFLLYGVVVGLIVWLSRRHSASPASVAQPSPAPSPAPSATATLGIVLALVNGALRPVLATLVLTVYALVTFGLVAHLTWNNFALVGDRGWVAGVLFVCCFAFFLADEVVVARPSRRARAGLYAATKVIVIVSLVVSVGLLGAPGFLLLLIPVIAVLFLWHGVYSHWLFGLAHRPWIAAVLNAAVFAWMIASTFAIVQY